MKDKERALAHIEPMLLYYTYVLLITVLLITVLLITNG